MLRKFISQILVGSMLLLVIGSEVSAQTRIRFRPGRATTSVSGRLAPGAKRTFVLSAKAWQNLTADLNSSNGGIRFGDGGTSINYDTDTGNNYVYISNIGKVATTFRLTISIR